MTAGTGTPDVQGGLRGEGLLLVKQAEGQRRPLHRLAHQERLAAQQQVPATGRGGGVSWGAQWMRRGTG